MKCTICQHQMSIQRFDCPGCGVRYEGEFTQPRLARLPAEMQQLAEQVLLAGGNLKEVSAWQDVSYPTLRKRVDALIAALEDLRRADDKEVARLLGEVETGRIQAEYAARRISEIQHGS